MIRKVFLLGLVLILSLTACGIGIDLPFLETGPTQSEGIEVPLPENTSLPTHLVMNFGAGELLLAPGAQNLVSGTASFNVEDLKPEIVIEEGSVQIKQGEYQFSTIPNIGDLVNTWDLKIGQAPIDLEISAGAYHATYELGGLALNNLTVKDGASDVELTFSSPNLIPMNLLKYESGASSVSLSSLANANFTLMEFKAGAGNFTLDFGGTLQRNASVSVNTGLGNLTLIIPRGMAVQLTVDGGLANTTITGDWIKQGDTYTQAGEGPMLTIVVEIGAANLVVAGD